LITCNVGSGQQVGEISFLVALETLPSEGEHTAIEFPDRFQGWITRSDGSLLYSGNAGLTWEPQNTPTTTPLLDLAFIDPTIGFVVGGCIDQPCEPGSGLILETYDSGETWTEVELDSPVRSLTTIAFPSPNRGVIAGDEVVLTTGNGGIRWDLHPRPGEVFEDLWFESVDLGYAVGRAGLVRVTEDGGETWTEVQTDHTGDLYAIAFSQGVGYIAGEDGLLRSFDEGYSWEMVSGAPTGLHAVHFIDLDSGIVGGEGASTAVLALTNDYGDNWLGGLDLDTVHSIRDFSFPNEDEGFAVGRGDQVIKLLRQ